MRGFLVLLSLGVTPASAADDEASRSAREELEKQLQQMVRIPPPQLEIVFNGIDASDYKLVGVSFTLDEQALPVSESEVARGAVLFSGQIAPGPHTLQSQLTYQEDPKTVFTYMAGTKFKVPGRIEFVAARGLRVHVRSGVHVDSNADLQHRLKAANLVQPEMVAQLEDGSMPPPPKPHIEAPAATVTVADATPSSTSDAPEEAAPRPDKRHKRTSRASEERHFVAAAAHQRNERHIVAAKEVVAPKRAEPEAPQALTAAPDAGAPVMVAMVTPTAPAVVAPSPPAVVEEEGMSLGMKLGLVAGATLLVLVGLTVFFRTRR